LSATVARGLDELLDNPLAHVHPGEGRGERETSDKRVERLGLEFSGDERDRISSLGSGHCGFIR